MALLDIQPDKVAEEEKKKIDGEELYKKHRPQSFKDLIGQDEAVKILNEMGKSGSLPHFLLFTGPSGCGKTTIARILVKKLKCNVDVDYTEINGSENRGIDMVRDIKKTLNLAPLGGKCRIYLIDEAHALTSDCMNALLKFLEDTPPTVYFFLCTTDPQKLKTTIRTRATEIKCKELSKSDLKTLCKDVAEKEGKELDDTVANRIALVAEGSARKALVILHAVIGLPTTEAQIAGVDSNDVKGIAINIARALINEKTSWKEMADILVTVEEDPESLRHMVMGYCRSILIKGQRNERAAKIIDEFKYNFYDSKANGLLIACYHVIND